MPRIKIEEPNRYLFKASVITRITDLNYGGHVGNDSIFSFMHDARVQLIDQLGYESEIDIHGLGFIQADAAISYKSELFAQQKLEILVGYADRTKYGCDFIYKFQLADGELIAIGKTGIVFFDYQTRKLSAAPQEFFKRLEALSI